MQDTFAQLSELEAARNGSMWLAHQPSGGTRGPASDIEIQAREIIKMNERLIKIFSKATGQSEEKIAKDIDRDYWLSAEEAIEYGLVSRIVTSQSEAGLSAIFATSAVSVMRCGSARCGRSGCSCSTEATAVSGSRSACTGGWRRCCETR